MFCCFKRPETLEVISPEMLLFKEELRSLREEMRNDPDFDSEYYLSFFRRFLSMNIPEETKEKIRELLFRKTRRESAGWES